MSTRQSINQKQLDLEILPEEARKDIIDFYEYLLSKYQKRLTNIDINGLEEKIEELSWEMGYRLYNRREELYER